MKYDTIHHERAVEWATEDGAFDGAVAAPTGAFAKLDLIPFDMPEMMHAAKHFGHPYLLITEDSDGNVYVRGYEKAERDRLYQKSLGMFNLWSAGVTEEEARAAIDGYLEAELFTATDEEGNPLQGGDHNWSIQAQEFAFDEVVDFITSNVDDCREFAEKHAGWTQVGIDFEFTRNGEGAGFWDRGVGDVGTRLTDAARPHGATHVFVTEDGELGIEHG